MILAESNYVTSKHDHIDLWMSMWSQSQVCGHERVQIFQQVQHDLAATFSLTEHHVNEAPHLLRQHHAALLDLGHVISLQHRISDILEMVQYAIKDTFAHSVNQLDPHL